MGIGAVVRVSLLATLCAVPLIQVRADAGDGVVKGVLSIDGRPATTAVEVAVVNVNTGAIKRVKSGRDGAFEVRLPPGDYVAGTCLAGGSTIRRAPLRILVRSGGVERIQLEITPSAVLTPTTAGPAATAATDSAMRSIGQAAIPATGSASPSNSGTFTSLTNGTPCCALPPSGACPTGCLCCCFFYPACCGASPDAGPLRHCP